MKSEVAICKRFKTCDEAVQDSQGRGLIMLITARDAMKTELARIISLIVATKDSDCTLYTIL